MLYQTFVLSISISLFLSSTFLLSLLGRVGVPPHHGLPVGEDHQQEVGVEADPRQDGEQAAREVPGDQDQEGQDQAARDADPRVDDPNQQELGIVLKEGR